LDEIFYGINLGHGCKTNTSKGEINDTFWDKFEKKQQDKKISVQHNHQ
jgi:hypothetical protein